MGLPVRQWPGQRPHPKGDATASGKSCRSSLRGPVQAYAIPYGWSSSVRGQPLLPYRSRRRRVGLRGVLSSLEEEASLVWLDQTGEQSSVQPRSLSLSSAGAVSGQMGIVRGSRTSGAGGGPANPEGQGLRSAPIRMEVDLGGCRPVVTSGGRAGMREGTPQVACAGTATPAGRGGRADEGRAPSSGPGWTQE